MYFLIKVREKKVQSHLQDLQRWWDLDGTPCMSKTLLFGNKGDIGCLLRLSQPDQCRRLFLVNCQGIPCASKVFCCLCSRPALM